MLPAPSKVLSSEEDVLSLDDEEVLPLPLHDISKMDAANAGNKKLFNLKEASFMILFLCNDCNFAREFRLIYTHSKK